MDIAKMFSRLTKTMTRAIHRLEDMPIPLWGVLVFYVVVAFIRSYFETTLLHPGIFLVIWFMWNAYFCAGFLTFSYLVSVAARRPSLKTLRASMAIVWLVIMPPIFDFYVLGRRVPYDYLFNQQIFKAVTEFFSVSAVGMGMRLEMSIYALVMFIYIGLMTRSWLRGAVSVSIISAISLTLFAEYPGIWLPIASYAAPALPSRPYQPSFLLLFYLVIALGATALMLRRQGGNQATVLWRGLAAAPMGMALLFCLAGLVFARQTIILALIGPVYVALSLITVALCLAAVRWAGVGATRGETRASWGWAASGGLLALVLSYLVSGLYGVVVIGVWLLTAAIIKMIKQNRPSGDFGQALLSIVWAVLAFLFGAIATRYQLLPEHFIEIGRAAAVALIVGTGVFIGPALRSAGKDKRRIEAAGALVFLTFLSPLLLAATEPVRLLVVVGAGVAAVITWGGRQVRLIQPLGVLVALVAFVYSSGLLTTKVIL